MRSSLEFDGAKFLKKQVNSVRRWRDRRKLYLEIQDRGFPPVLWSKGYAAFAEQNGGLKEALGRTEKRWNLKKFLSLYSEDANSYWIPLTSKANRGDPSPLDWFADYILPKIQKPFVLITTDGDASVPKSFSEKTISRVLSNKNLCLWYSQNLTDINFSQKLRGLPIGLDLHRRRCGLVGWGLFHTLESIASQSTKRERKAVVDFCSNRNSSARRYLCEHSHDNKDFTVLQAPLGQIDLWRLYSESSYVISPEGVGPDCHRTWEALYLGATVICKDIGLGHLYKNLPVYQVASWDEVFDPKLFHKVDDHVSNISSSGIRSSESWLSEFKNVLMSSP